MVKTKKLIDKSDPYRKGTRLYQAVAKAEKAKFLASEAGQKAIEHLRLTDEMSIRLQIKSMILTKSSEKDERSELLDSLMTRLSEYK